LNVFLFFFVFLRQEKAKASQEERETGQERRAVALFSDRIEFHFPWKRKRKGYLLLLLLLDGAQLVKQPHECLTLVNDRARRLIYEQINSNGEEFFVSDARERRALSLVPRPYVQLSVNQQTKTYNARPDDGRPCLFSNLERNTHMRLPGKFAIGIL
jgi:hypothetical protein